MRKRWLITTTAAALSLAAVGASAAAIAGTSHLADEEGIEIGGGAHGTGETITAPDPVTAALGKAGAANDSNGTDPDRTDPNPHTDASTPDSDDSTNERLPDPATPPPPVSVESPDSPESLD